MEFDKENVDPKRASTAPMRSEHGGHSPQKPARRGRSKSIGPGGFDNIEMAAEAVKSKQADARSRRKSAYVPATKSIISAQNEKAERQAARRKTLANRRVSFAPEATLHTWDVIEFMRDTTASTESSNSTRTAQRHETNSPRKDDSSGSVSYNDPTNAIPQKAIESKRRRSSGIPPMNFNNPEEFTSSGSDVSDEEQDEQDDTNNVGFDQDEDSTAMSLDVDNDTTHSAAESSSSTDSSGVLDAALRQAAETAGTRGIEFDEHGEDMSMEIAGDEITDAFRPWVVQRAAASGQQSLPEDKENVNPFSTLPTETIDPGEISEHPINGQDNTEDLSMDMTRAVGSVLTGRRAADTARGCSPERSPDVHNCRSRLPESPSPTKKVSKKREHGLLDEQGIGYSSEVAQSKRRRSSAAQSSSGDESMDLTLIVGGLEKPSPVIQPGRVSRPPMKSLYDTSADVEEATMEFTRAVGGIRVEEDDQHVSDYNSNAGGSRREDFTSDQCLDKGIDQQPALGPVISTSITTRTSHSLRMSDTVAFTSPHQVAGINSSPTGRLRQNMSVLSPPKNSSLSIQTPKGAGIITAEDKAKRENASSTSPCLLPGSYLSTVDVDFIRTQPSNSMSEDKQTGAHSDGQEEDGLGVSLASAQLPADKKESTHRRGRSSTPDRNAKSSTKQLVESIKGLSTPQKKPTLRVSIEAKKSPTPAKPLRDIQKKGDLSPDAKNVLLGQGLTELDTRHWPAHDVPINVRSVKLQEFLDLAGIRFMDITTTKRRFTLAPTPSKVRQNRPQESHGKSIGTAVVAGSCIVPELEMYEHACHELRRYISDGKKVIKELESQTAKTNPPLVCQYVAAGLEQRATIDGHMRDIKTQARLRSKEVWYGWRGQLLEDLMKALQSIGEGMICDDDLLQRSNENLAAAIPALDSRCKALRIESTSLAEQAEAVQDEQKDELESARQALKSMNLQKSERLATLVSLKMRDEESRSKVKVMETKKLEHVAAIDHARSFKDMFCTVSLSEVDQLNASLSNLEHSSGWSISAAHFSSLKIDLTYKSQLRLSLQPSMFSAFTSSRDQTRHNGPISLAYLRSSSLSTVERFFLQALRSRLQGIQQHRTRIKDLLRYVAKGWDTALAVTEMERQMKVELPTKSLILSDNHLEIASDVLIVKAKRKIRVSFDLFLLEPRHDSDGVTFEFSVTGGIKLIYGHKCDLRGAASYMATTVKEGCAGWNVALRYLCNDLNDSL